MKKIFYLFCIAAIVCSVFTSCFIPHNEFLITRNNDTIKGLISDYSPKYIEVQTYNERKIKQMKINTLNVKSFTTYEHRYKDTTNWVLLDPLHPWIVLGKKGNIGIYINRWVEEANPINEDYSNHLMQEIFIINPYYKRIELIPESEEPTSFTTGAALSNQDLKTIILSINKIYHQHFSPIDFADKKSSTTKKIVIDKNAVINYILKNETLHIQNSAKSS